MTSVKIMMNCGKNIEDIKDIITAKQTILSAFVNGKLIVLKNQSLDLFVRTILINIGMDSISNNQSAKILTKICNLTNNDLPKIVHERTKKMQQETSSLNIILGAGSNNIDIEKSNDYIIDTMKYWERGNLKRIYVEVSGKQNFTYYIDLNSKKRFLKNPNEMKDFVHFEILKNKELEFLKTKNEEEVYSYRD